MKRWLNLIIVFAFIFGGGLALAFELVAYALLLFITGATLGYYLNRRNLLPA